jgi:site-specific recombinase XerD
VFVADVFSDGSTLRRMTEGDGLDPCRVQRLALPGGTATWTVLGADHVVVGPAEEFLEFLRVQASSPNTVKSYARALALWWSYLLLFGLAWDKLAVAEVGGFLAWLRSGDSPRVSSIQPCPARFAEATIATRLHAVMSLYRFHELNGVPPGSGHIRLQRRRARRR